MHAAVKRAHAAGAGASAAWETAPSKTDARRRGCSLHPGSLKPVRGRQEHRRLDLSSICKSSNPAALRGPTRVLAGAFGDVSARRITSHKPRLIGSYADAAPCRAARLRIFVTSPGTGRSANQCTVTLACRAVSIRAGSWGAGAAGAGSPFSARCQRPLATCQLS